MVFVAFCFKKSLHVLLVVTTVYLVSISKIYACVTGISIIERIHYEEDRTIIASVTVLLLVG